MKVKDTERNAPTCELAQRLSGGDEVLLLWHPELDRVELSVRDVVAGSGLHIEVESRKALDAFYHPYAYTAARDAHRVNQGEAAVVDG
jgi:hypothetical protein